MLEETDSATLILYLAQLGCAPGKFEPTRLALAQLSKTHPSAASFSSAPVMLACAQGSSTTDSS